MVLHSFPVPLRSEPLALTRHLAGVCGACLQSLLAHGLARRPVLTCTAVLFLLGAGSVAVLYLAALLVMLPLWGLVGLL